MGTFVTDPDAELFEDKERAPGLALRSGWTEKHVLSAENANALRDACLDLKDAVVDLQEIAEAGVNLSDADPLPIATASPGTGLTASREDHVHAHGNLAGGTFHAVAGASAGFMSAADKTKLDGIATGANVGVTTVDPVGSTPNANGASISSTTLTLQPASGTQPGVVTTGAQTIAGAKTFASSPTVPGLVMSDTAAPNTLTSATAATAGGDTAFIMKALNAYDTTAAHADAILDLRRSDDSAVFRFNSSGRIVANSAANGSQPGFAFTTPTGGSVLFRLAGGGGEQCQLIAANSLLTVFNIGLGSGATKPTTNIGPDLDEFSVNDTVVSVGALNFRVDTNVLFVDAANDRVGVGTTGPTQKLEVAGTIYSTTGGFKFPDGTTQSSAAAALSIPFTVSGSNAAAHLAKWRNTSATGFSSIQFYDSSDVARFSFGFANSGTSSPYTSKAFLSLDSTSAYRLERTGTVIYEVPASTQNVAFDTDVLFVDAANNRVGIGTASPERKLHVLDSVSGHLATLKNSSATGYSSLAFVDSSNVERFSFGFANASAGDTTVAGKAFVSLDATAGYRLARGSAVIMDVPASSQNVAFDTNTLFVDAANDRVGVGTASPAAGYKLDVSGVVRATNHVTSYDISATYLRNTSQSLPSGADTLVDFATADFDTHSAVTTGAAWKFTVPSGAGGKYLVTTSIAITGPASDFVALAMLWKNGVFLRRLARDDKANGSISLAGCVIVNLVAGDYVDVRVFTSSASVAVEAATGASFISICRLPGA